ncbi:MAG: formate--tetrahydrofolate ligase [Aeriscardovia sp.]|nr:formate--tetrahydrofolate ligase [Aeriscardovia sp.]
MTVLTQSAFEAHPKKKGRLVLVTAAPPLAASRGEGKTSCTLALLDALRIAGASACAVLRQPSMGISAAGAKGGASGVGASGLKEAEEADFGLQGEMLRVGAYQNLLVGFAEKELEGEGKVLLSRTSDVPTKYLRKVKAGGIEETFVLTPTGELEQIRVLSRSRGELEKSLKDITAGKRGEKFIQGKDLPLESAWPVLQPACRISFLSTLRGSPVYMYCGPFANVSLGIPGLSALDLALCEYDFVLMEAGYGFDMGMQKYLDTASKRHSPLPCAAVAVARRSSMEGPLAWRYLAGLKCMRRLGIEPIPLLNVFEGENRQVPFPGVLSLNPAKDGQKELVALGSALLSRLDKRRPMEKKPYKGSLPLLPRIAYVCSNFYGVSPGRVRFTRGFKASYLSALAQAKAEGLDLSGFILNMVKSPSSLTDDDFKKFSRRTVTVKNISLNSGSKVANVRVTLAPTAFLPRVV